MPFGKNPLDDLKRRLELPEDHTDDEPAHQKRRRRRAQTAKTPRGRHNRPKPPARKPIAD